MNDQSYPVGDEVSPLHCVPPSHVILAGEFVSLRPIDVERDVNSLFEVSHGDAATERMWTYMNYGPFANEAGMQVWLEGCGRSTDPLFLAAHHHERDTAVGMVSFLNIVADMRCVEVGNIWYGPALQRSKVNTECVYLMLRYVFDDLSYRRVEWKCDALNQPSRNAALRLGFRFEGTFLQHMIIKGRNRDTAWYALLDHEWPRVKRNMETWLYQDDTASLRTLNDTP